MLGKVLVRRLDDGVVALRLTEVEAYLGVGDRACHTFGGRRTARVAAMWGPAGHAYVYRIYGVHYCLNVVTVGEGVPEAVLLRAGEVLVGGELARRRRGRGRRLVAGPGMLCQATAVTLAEDGGDLCYRAGGLWLVDDGRSPADHRVAATPRVGVAHAGDAAAWLLRFVVVSR